MGGEYSSKDTRGVDDWDEVVGQVVRHARRLRLDDDEVEGEEGAEVDEERADGQKQERQLGERDEVLLHRERLRGGGQARLDGDVAED